MKPLGWLLEIRNPHEHAGLRLRVDDNISFRFLKPEIVADETDQPRELLFALR
jgi:hypothetical protein